MTALVEVLQLHALWQKGKPGGVRASINGLDWSGRYFKDEDLSGASMHRADLGRVGADSVKFRGVNATATSFAYGNFDFADFTSLHAARSLWDGAVAECAVFKGANLCRSSMLQASFMGSDFSNADLRYCDFRNANVSSCNFKGALLEGADFTGADTDLAVFDEGALEATPLTLQGLLERQREFSISTFGPGARVEGVIDHIGKELIEVRESDGQLDEWVDVVLLALDGAQRTGEPLDRVSEAILDKLERNIKREWPDWRQAPQDKAIEHLKGGE